MPLPPFSPHELQSTEDSTAVGANIPKVLIELAADEGDHATNKHAHVFPSPPQSPQPAKRTLNDPAGMSWDVDPALLFSTSSTLHSSDSLFPDIPREEVEEQLAAERDRASIAALSFTSNFSLYRKSPKNYLWLQRLYLRFYRRRVVTIDNSRPRRLRAPSRRKHELMQHQAAFDSPRRALKVPRRSPSPKTSPKKVRAAPASSPKPGRVFEFWLVEDKSPPVETLDRIARPLRGEWKGTALDLSGDPYVHLLHPSEISFASTLRLRADQYLDSKRRIFLEVVRRMRKGLPFLRTNAQQVTMIDVNKASRLWVAFDRIGWFDRVYFEKYL